MRLYHASTLCIEKPDVLHFRDKLDFGRGFYLTAMRDQAVRYAERFTRRGKDAYINEYELDENTPEFVTKSFPSYDEEWLDYVRSAGRDCRRGRRMMLCRAAWPTTRCSTRLTCISPVSSLRRRHWDG